MIRASPAPLAALPRTLGPLALLPVDTRAEALELAAALPGARQGDVLVWPVTTLAGLMLLVFDRCGGRVSDEAVLVSFVALGIGPHDPGEGLAIGAARRAGEVASPPSSSPASPGTM